jgi:phosphoadenosine phosphosulfate reductase
MNITPPGDVKPAFDKEMEHIRDIINENYGDNIGDLLFPRNKIYLINKIPGLDLTEEIITDGRTYGTYYFDPIKQKFDFKPKRPAAILMLRLAKDYKLELKRRFEISDDSVPYLLKGMSLLAPGIVSFSPNI